MKHPTRSIVLALVLAAVAAAWPSAQPSLPTPQSVIGWQPCADYKLATYEQIAEYFRTLAAAAPARMRIVEMGKTVEGRTQIMAIVSSEENIRQLEKYKDVARRLAIARGLDDRAAHALARDGKAVVWIDFGLHSSEVAHAQTAPLLAFKVVSEDSPEMRAIRDNVILLLVPNMNPDGTTYVADWYRSNLGKPWEGRPPELWHKYVGHDDNRDWFMMTQPETRNSARQLYTEWFPEIVYNQHQSGPFPSRIFVPPFDDPMNPNIPPLVMRGVNLIGDAMTRRLDEEGKRGAISRVGFDTWWDGGMRTAPYFHNMVGILTETSHASATPAHYDPKSFPKTFANGIPTLEPSTYYPSPYLGGDWHMRDSCEYMVTTSMAVLDLAAKRRGEWLYDIYQMGRDAIRAHERETFVVPMGPGAQWDPGTAVKMVNVLRLGGVEVRRADAPFNIGSTQYAAGSFLIPGAQPFEPYVKDLLTPQVYPDMRLYPGGPPKRPYDITGWTLSYQMGVRVDRLDQSVSVVSQPVDVAPAPSMPMPAASARTQYYAIDPRDNDAFVAVNRLLRAGDLVYRTRTTLRVGAAQWPAGAFLVASRPGTAARLRGLASSLAIAIAAVDRPPAASSRQELSNLWRLKTPRVAVYHAWGGNMDEGWTRWLLEQFEFPYAQLHDADVRAGGLRSKYDVILLPDATPAQMTNGLAPGSMPPEYTGGMTAQGVEHLHEFVTEGGTLVAMDRAAELPPAMFGLPVRNVAAELPPSQFFIPGSVLKIAVDGRDPVAYGMPADAAAFFINSPAFAVTAPAPGVHVVARYPEQGILMSGWALGDRTLAGQAAAIDATVGRGRVVLLGFRSEHRGQTHGTFRLLFNAILLGGAEPDSSR